MTTRIMVIDDEPLICTLLEYQLGGAGYNVTSFQSGEQALLRLAHERPDLILLDVMMPEISGWDLCRQIRASSAVPVIMLTAKYGDSDVVTGLTNGADDYVAKPFNQAQLIARIEAVLRRSQGRTPRPAPGAARATSLSLSTPAPQQRSVALPVAQNHHPRAHASPIVAAATIPAAPLIAAPRTARPASAAPQRLGPRLAEARRQRGLSLRDAAQASGVRWEFLQAIEQEEFSFVPRVELRNALKAYSSLLDVDLAPYSSRRRRRGRGQSQLSLAVALAALLAISLVLIALAL